MKVKELIEMLQCEDQEMEVRFACPSHDYWKTQIAKDVSYVESVFTKYSDYHQQDVVADDDEVNPDCNHTVVIF